MQFYNSLTRKIESFAPLEGNKVWLYVCGLTPYDHTHIGHARTYVAFDMLKRYLLFKGYEVFHIQNVTDVDDKILRRARENGEDPRKLAESVHSEAMLLFDRLHIVRANAYPKVTEHIPEIIALIEKIMANGYAYETDTGVYFDVPKFKGYGSLSGQKMEEIIAGSRKEVDETKRSPEDFALWKKAKGEAIEFDSPWGKGRPGWHIECSAMAGKYTKTLDIHGGARDLIFPHHENEIAQSEAAGAKPFVRFWLHTGFLTVKGEKMSKSLGNFVPLKDVLAEHSPNAVRMFFAMAHYRSPIDYNPAQIKQAESTVERMLGFAENIDRALEQREKPFVIDESLEREVKNKFRNFYQILEMDFDLPTAITFIFSIMRSVNANFESDKVDYQALSYASTEMKSVFYLLGIERERKELGDRSKDFVNLLVELREDARKRKDFEASDKIRERLRQLGVSLEDGQKTKMKVL